MVADFALDRDRIRIADVLLVYLERARASPGVVPLGNVPRPYGTLPLAMAPAEITSGGTASAEAVVAPAMPGEAIWLGFQPVDRDSPVTVRVRIDKPQEIDAITGEAWDGTLRRHPRNFLISPPHSSLAGRAVSGGRRLFGTDTFEWFTVFVWGSVPVGVAVILIRPDVFARLTGREPPSLDSDAGFTGRRLP